MFRILLDLPRSLILNKDLLLHVNLYKTLKNVHTKIIFEMAGMPILWNGFSVVLGNLLMIFPVSSLVFTSFLLPYFFHSSYLHATPPLLTNPAGTPHPSIPSPPTPTCLMQLQHTLKKCTIRKKIKYPVQYINSVLYHHKIRLDNKCVKIKP